MIDEARGDRDKLRKLINTRFNELSWLDGGKVAANFYAIGGSFRALAKMHMALTDYPLHILHEYTVDAKKFLAFVRDIAAMPETKLEKHPGVAAKRIAALPGASMILERIIETAKPQQVVFRPAASARGIYMINYRPLSATRMGCCHLVRNSPLKAGGQRPMPMNSING